MVLLSESSSEISSLSSDSPEPDNDYDSPAVDEPALPPSKRQKIRDDSRASSSVHVDPEPAEPEPELDGDISSDTSGDVPNSPINAKLDEEEAQEQVTVCAWDGCDAGDQGNMDNLVEHIHNDHIESRQKKYTCEWIGCTRKSMPHASGYALKAHMRSHTREKPFYCYLPECDRAFTRSDALAKHMRTVHETEALRPSDPVPKSLQHERADKAKQNNRLKIVLKTQQPHGAQDDSMDDGGDNEDVGSDFFTVLTEQHGFTSKELEIGQGDIHSLWRLCVANVKWATEEGTTLREQCKELEELYRQEWLEKEVLLEQVEGVEVDWWQRRHAVLSGAADIQVGGASQAKTSRSRDPEETDQEGDDVEVEPETSKDKEIEVAAD
ncbi:C2H2 finger domain protein [Seiridium cupressi]